MLEYYHDYYVTIKLKHMYTNIIHSFVYYRQIYTIEIKYNLRIRAHDYIYIYTFSYELSPYRFKNYPTKHACS